MRSQDTWEEGTLGIRKHFNILTVTLAVLIGHLDDVMGTKA